MIHAHIPRDSYRKLKKALKRHHEEVLVSPSGEELYFLGGPKRNRLFMLTPEEGTNFNQMTTAEVNEYILKKLS